MAEVALNINESQTVIVPFTKRKEVKYKKDGEIKRTHSNKVAGKSSLVKPIKDREKLKEYINYFKDRVNNASGNDRMYAQRNYTMVLFGLCSGLRISDIVSRKWEDVMYDGGEYRETIRVQEKKTKKYRDFFLSDLLKMSLDDYRKNITKEYGMDDYIFFTRQSNHMTIQGAYNIIKQAAKACGIKENIGTHSLRKTFGYTSMKTHEDDAMFLATLMRLYGHSSEAVTLRYCGIDEDESRQLYTDIGNSFSDLI